MHSALGWHRHDAPRTGWISGLDEERGRKHPTQGGLRIGKALTERGLRDSFDEGLEWDRDGQYYHCLTKWMHALKCVTGVTGEFTYNRWATETKDPEPSMESDLHAEILDMGNICEGKSWTTDDPLGIGGLLFDAYRVDN